MMFAQHSDSCRNSHFKVQARKEMVQMCMCPGYKVGGEGRGGEGGGEGRGGEGRGGEGRGGEGTTVKGRQISRDAKVDLLWYLTWSWIKGRPTVKGRQILNADAPHYYPKPH